VAVVIERADDPRDPQAQLSTRGQREDQQHESGRKPERDDGRHRPRPACGHEPGAERPGAAGAEPAAARAQAASITPALTSAITDGATSRSITMPAAWSSSTRTPERVAKRMLRSPKLDARVWTGTSFR
jgi:hypothetical protein